MWPKSLITIPLAFVGLIAAVITTAYLYKAYKGVKSCLEVKEHKVADISLSVLDFSQIGNEEVAFQTRG